MTEVLVGAVRAGETAELVTLHHAGSAAALADPAHVDDVAGREHVADPHVLADLELRVGADVELAQHAERTLVGLRDVTTHRLPDPALFLRTEAELHGGVAVARRRLRLHHRARPRLHHRHRHEVALAGEHLRHADLLPDDSRHHGERPVTAA